MQLSFWSLFNFQTGRVFGAQVRFPPKTHSSLFHYDQLSLINIVRYFYTCTVLKLAIMIFVHFPSDLTKLLPNYVFLDCIKISEKKIYNSNRQVTWIIRFYLLT